MSSYLKSVLKKSLPKSALRWRTRKVLNSGMEPDLYLLANMRKHLSGIQGGEKFLDHFSKGQSAIDVGACGGEYSCVMSSMFGKVFSIEPTADMAEWLKKRTSSELSVDGVRHRSHYWRGVYQSAQGKWG